MVKETIYNKKFYFSQIAKDKEAENVYYQSSELDNDKINKLCGLTDEDIMAIKAWLDDRLI